MDTRGAMHAHRFIEHRKYNITCRQSIIAFVPAVLMQYIVVRHQGQGIYGV